MTRHSRRAYLATLTIGAVAGCTQPAGGFPWTSDAEDTDSDDDVGDHTRGDLPTSDRELLLPDLPAKLLDSKVSGVVPRDGIPSIDNPQFHDGAAADERIDGGDPVFGIAGENDMKAYPQRVLVWHEIVNDVIDDVPVAVTYCPLTGTAQGFYRGGTEFGVSGHLLNSNLIMYDRESESYWPQMLATAISGPHTGDVLQEFSVTWTTWDRWRDRYPETELLSEDTGFVRDYDRDPYGSYNPLGGFYESDSVMFRPYAEENDRFHGKAVVLGARSNDGAVAVHKDSLRDEGILEGNIGETSVVAVYDSALDTGYLYRNPNNHEITLESNDVVVEDDPHEPASLPLDRILRYDAFWFAWAGYYPDTAIIA